MIPNWLDNNDDDDDDDNDENAISNSHRKFNGNEMEKIPLATPDILIVLDSTIIIGDLNPGISDSG